MFLNMQNAKRLFLTFLNRMLLVTLDVIEALHDHSSTYAISKS